MRGAFAVLLAVGGQDDDTFIDKFNGLFKRNPLLAVGLTIALLSLAGIPPLPGFFGKYLVFALAIAKGQLGFVILAVVTSLIGVYYYFRVLIAMYFKDSGGQPIFVKTSSQVLTIVLILLTLLLGVFVDPIVKLLA